MARKKPTKLQKTAVFKGVECDVYEFEHPPDSGRPALVLFERGSGEEYTRATVYLEGETEKLAPDEVLVRDWSGNRGMMAALERAGIALNAGRSVPTGFVRATVARLLYERDARASINRRR